MLVLLLVVVYCSCLLVFAVRGALLFVVGGLLCVVRCFPVLLSVCWWYFVGVRCLVFGVLVGVVCVRCWCCLLVRDVCGLLLLVVAFCCVLFVVSGLLFVAVWLPLSVA